MGPGMSKYGSAISFGTSAEAVEAVGKVILDILGAGREERTTREAIAGLAKAVSVSGITLQGGTVYGGDYTVHNHEAAPDGTNTFGDVAMGGSE